MTPICIDLFCGLGGWTEGFLAEGYTVYGFDIEQHVYGEARYPAQLIIQDVRTIHGKQFKDAACIVASPPCQEYSYMAMPWTRAKQIQRALLGQGSFPEGYAGSRTVAELNTLFNECFRIQREACEAAGRYIPMVVENVRGAIPWVGRPQWHYGSFHLWGDVPALMPISKALKFNPDGTNHPAGSWFAIADSSNRGSKGVPHRPTGHWTNPAENGLKLPGNNAPRKWADREVQRLCDAGTKQGGDWYSTPGSISRTTGGRSSARKAASAEIAKIPFPLSRHIARVFKP